MNDKCPRCLNAADVIQGKFRDLTNARFDTDYADGISGMAAGVKVKCNICGEINLFLRDWNSLLCKEIDPEDVTNFQKIYPNFQGVIPLSAWLDSAK